MEPGREVVDPDLGLPHIALQIGGKAPDAAHKLGQHKGKDGRHHAEEQQVGQSHRQRDNGLFQGSPRQQTVQVAAEKGAGLGEHKGDGQADEQGAAHREHAGHSAPQHVEFDDDQDEQHGEGNEQQKASKKLFIHPDTPISMM